MFCWFVVVLLPAVFRVCGVAIGEAVVDVRTQAVRASRTFVTARAALVMVSTASRTAPDGSVEFGALLYECVYLV